MAAIVGLPKPPTLFLPITKKFLNLNRTVIYLSP